MFREKSFETAPTKLLLLNKKKRKWATQKRSSVKRPTGNRPKLKIGFKVVMTRQKAWRTSYCG